MAPIRIAIIGLSVSAKTSWAANAHLPYLLSPRGRARYEIVALCNSSVESARKAIEHFNLPKETKAYGDAESLANDKDIEFVVVSTRVDVHYETALPSAKVGKNLFVEWPLAQDVSHADDLASIVKESGSRAVVGIQGRLAPTVIKLRELVRQGWQGLEHGLKYFTQKSVGGNVVTIGFAHIFDQVQHVLGDIGNFTSQLQIQRPQVKVRDPATNAIVETVTSDVPDLIFAAGTLSASELAQEGANVLFRFRRGQPFHGEPALTWKINGEKGEIRLISQSSTALQASADSGSVKIEVENFETDEVESVSWGWQDWQEELPVMARTVGALYEAFADGNGEGLASFPDAAFRHQQLAQIWKGY